MSHTPEQTMSDSRELRNPMGEPLGSLSESSTKSVCLSRDEAATWLLCVNQSLENGNQPSELKSLRNALEDACWLGRWKRENVIVELCPTVLPSTLDSLIQIHGEEPSSEVAEDLETIIRRLSA